MIRRGDRVTARRDLSALKMIGLREVPTRITKGATGEVTALYYDDALATDWLEIRLYDGRLIQTAERHWKLA